MLMLIPSLNILLGVLELNIKNKQIVQGCYQITIIVIITTNHEGEMGGN